MWIAIAFFAGLWIGGGLVWVFAPRPYVDDDIVVEAERIVSAVAESDPKWSPYRDRMRALLGRL